MRLLALLALLFSFSIFSQENATFKIRVQSENLETLIGATVKVSSKSESNVYGGFTNREGVLNLENIVPGEYQVTVSYIGYQSLVEDIILKPGSNEATYTLLGGAIRSKTIQVVADRAKFRETPIAFSSISKEDIELKLGGDDIPIILNETPGVYATRNGQGFGESRINIRGFKQRNIAVMINGVPVNDMENGRVFWSNWDGIGDVTSSQQVQRGLGASKIANPSVGGTMNIITDAAKRRPGFTYKQQYGFYDDAVDNFELVDQAGNTIYDKPFNSRFHQSRFIFNTGLINKFALTAAVNRKVGEGPTDATWIEAYSYYLGMSYDLSKNHYLDFYLYGAPQVRGRKAFRLPVAAYDSSYAADLGIDSASIAATQEITGINYGRFHNPNWGYFDGARGVSPQNSLLLDNDRRDWHYGNRLNRYHNFYHKPHATLNWYWQIDDKSSLTTVAYLSTGSGGGTNTNGFPVNQDQNGSNLMLWDQAFESNLLNFDYNYDDVRPRSEQVLTSSVNNHFWTGGLITYDKEFRNNLKIQTGLDFRYYEAEHYRSISHMLSSPYAYYIEGVRDPVNGGFVDSVANDNLAQNNNIMDRKKFIGDKITYYYDGRVFMGGGFFQLEKKWEKITYYFNSSVVNSSYEREDYFRLPERRIANASFFGYTVKTGANFNINDNFNIYSNNGYFSRPPFFNTVFTDQNDVIQESDNERVLGIELGSGYRNDDRNFESNLNLYYTNWINQNNTYFVNQGGAVESDYGGAILTTGQDALHVGIEWDFYYKPFSQAWFKGSISLGDWRWTSNPNLVPIDTRIPDSLRTYPVEQFFINGLRVGDAPQKMLFLSATWLPFRNIPETILGRDYNNFLISASFKYNWDFYTDFQPDALTNYVGYFVNGDVDNLQIPQPWKVPAFWTINVFMSYRFYDVWKDVDLEFKFRINNITDEIYVSDANFRDPVAATVNNGVVEGNFDRADEAEVHLGWPRSYNLELKVQL